MKALGYITLTEAEEISGIKADTLKKRCQEGTLPGAIKQGKTWFVPKNQIIQELGSSLDDKLLTWLVNFAEGGIGIDVTLLAGGTFIAGQLISAKEYLERMNSAIKNVPQQNDNTQKAIQAFDLLLTTLTKNLPPQEEFLSTPINAVHLDNVSIWNNSTPPTPLKGSLIRIKLNAVDGFMWGRLG